MIYPLDTLGDERERTARMAAQVGAISRGVGPAPWCDPGYRGAMGNRDPGDSCFPVPIFGSFGKTNGNGEGGKMKAIKVGKKWGILENILFETKAEAEGHIEQIQETLMKAIKIVNAFEALPEQEKARLEAQSEIDKAMIHLPEEWNDIIH
jgi:hypothetical protein